MANPNDILNYAVEEAGNTSTDSLFWSWFFPGAEQREQFGQQVALQREQNDWNSETEKMKRLQAAGVNPLTAAEGVSGSGGSSSVGAPPAQPNNTGIPAAVESVGNVVDKMSAAGERNTLLDERRKNLISDTFLKYKQAGYTDEQSKGLAIANAFLPTEKFLGILTLEANMDKIKAEYKSLMQGIEESKARIDEIDAKIELAKEQGNLASKMALEAEKRTILIESQTKEQDWFNNIHDRYQIDPRNPLENNILMLGITDSPDYEKSVNIVRDVKFNESTGQFQAERDYAQSIAFRRAKGAEIAKTEYSKPETLKGFILQALKGVDNRVGAEIGEAIKQFRGNGSSGKSIRRTLSISLGELTSDKVKTDDPDTQKAINEILGLLQLSDKDLEEWARQ